MIQLYQNLYQKNRSKEMIYQVEKNIRFKTSMLRSDLCDYSDAYFTRKNKGPFKSCITKINNIFIENAENFDLVMPMYNLLEYNNN